MNRFRAFFNFKGNTDFWNFSRKCFIKLSTGKKNDELFGTSHIILPYEPWPYGSVLEYIDTP